MKGVITKSTGSWFQVKTLDSSQQFACRIRGKFRLEGFRTTNPLAVGDEVEFEFETNNEEFPDTPTGIITKLYPRKNYIIRKSNKLSSHSQIIASNLDLVLPVVTLFNPTTSQGFLDRILLIAEAYHIPAIIVFNKIDTLPDEGKLIMEEWIEMYESIGYPCIQLSATLSIGMDELSKAIEGKTTLICGHSGVGKTTILNALDPSLSLKTSTISFQHLKGKHTTTFAEMHSIKEDTFVIDTPGIRDFGIIDVEKNEMGHFFPEIRSRMGLCKFNNCLHVNEPHCEVINALGRGELSETRYQTYLGLIFDKDIFE
jgi:ribosome biogenesis GTPase